MGNVLIVLRDWFRAEQSRQIGREQVT